jgi:hypothetical protein
MPHGDFLRHLEGKRVWRLVGINAEHDFEAPIWNHPHAVVQCRRLFGEHWAADDPDLTKSLRIVVADDLLQGFP